MKNLLTNPKLLDAATNSPHLIRCWTTHDPDQDYYETEAYGNVTRPAGWFLWCVHTEEARHVWDPDNQEGWVVPEVKLTEIALDGSRVYPDRWHGDARALVFFNRDRTSIGGIGQVVPAVVGHTFSAGGWGEGWNCGNEFGGDPHCSWGAECEPFAMLWDEIRQAYDGQTADALQSLRFRVGIDPRGGVDPLADHVVWGPAIAIYNDWAEIPAVSIEAEADHVTLFVWAENRLRTHMNDRYVTDFWLVDNADPADPLDDEEPAIPADYGYPVVVKGPKWHPHADGEGGSYDMLRYMVEHGHPFPFITIMAAQPDKVWAKRAKELSPTTKVICRLMRGVDPSVNVEGPNFGGSARAYMDNILPIIRDNPEVDWWQLWNEQDPEGEDGHVQMARFGIDCMDIAEEEGAKLALLSDSTGVPEFYEWKAIWERTSFFQRAKAGGHILSLRAYGRTTDEVHVEYHLMRPQRLYEEILIPNDCVIPFVHTEYNINEDYHKGGIWDLAEFPTVADLLAEWKRADGLFGEMWYCLGVAGFTMGLSWAHYNMNIIWREICDMLLSVRDRANALPPTAAPEPEPEDEGYDRHVIIADPTYMDEGQLDAAYQRGRVLLRTVTPSWNDAVPWEEDRPEEWRTNTVDAGPLPADDRGRYQAWVHARDPETVLLFDEAPDPDPVDPPVGGFEILDVRSQMPTNPDSPWHPWARRSLSEITHVFIHHSATPPSSSLDAVTAIAAYHASATGKNRPGICYAYVVGEDGTAWQVSDLEDVVFSQGSNEHPGDENRFGVGICCLGNFVDGQGPTYAQLASIEALIAHVEDKVGAPLQVWGHKDVASTQCPGEAWPWREDWGRFAKPDPEPVLLGFNDHPGETGTAAEWLTGLGKGGLIVRPIFLGGAPAALNLSKAEAAGVRVIVNLRYSWSTDCGGAGTLPSPDTSAWKEFIAAAIATIDQSVGVWGWTVGNEANNPREFPLDGNLTPEIVVRAYSGIRAGVGAAGIRMAPGALDPFNAQAGDPREWLLRIWEGIDGAEFVAAHGYVRGPDPDLVGSPARFQDSPLEWQYLNYPGCIDALLNELPSRYQGLPLYVTEFNHLWDDGGEGSWGWVDDDRAAEVVRRAVAAGSHFAGIALYRWAGDEWAVEHNGAVLEAIHGLLS